MDKDTYTGIFMQKKVLKKLKSHRFETEVSKRYVLLENKIGKNINNSQVIES